MEGNSYVVLNERLILFSAKDCYNIATEQFVNGGSRYEFVGVNKTGKEIVMLIDGLRTMNELKEYICSTFDIDYTENEEWIEQFLITLNKKNVLEFKEEPHKCSIWKVRGDENQISPLHMTVEVTHKCNLACKHCYLSASIKKDNVMTIDKFRKLVSILKENGVMNIELTGGEVFVNPDSYEIVKLALENFAIVGLLTNGTLVDDKTIDLLAKYKSKVIINVSIDSINSELHDSFRGCKGSFEKSCDTIRRLSSKGLTVRMASSIFEENMWEVDKLADLAINLGAKVFTYNFIENFGRGKAFLKSRENDIKTVKFEDYYKYVLEVVEKYKDIIAIEESEEYIKGLKNCGSGTISVAISPEGNIRPCVLPPKEISLGNIFDEDYREIFDRDIFSEIGKIKPPNKENGCAKDCKSYTICKGCYLKAFNINTENEEPCEWIVKNNLFKLLEGYKRSCQK